MSRAGGVELQPNRVPGVLNRKVARGRDSVMRSLKKRLDITKLEKQQAQHEGNSISHSLTQRIAACCRNAGRSIGEGSHLKH